MEGLTQALHTWFVVLDHPLTGVISPFHKLPSSELPACSSRELLGGSWDLVTSCPDNPLLAYGWRHLCRATSVDYKYGYQPSYK